MATQSKNNANSGESETVDELTQIIAGLSMRPEKCLLYSMVGLKPCGINKHLNILLIREKMCKQLRYPIKTQSIWNYINSKWNIENAETLEDPPVIFNEDFTLPNEYNQFISEQSEKIKKMMVKEKLNNEIKKRKMLARTGKLRYKSNSMSSVDSKDGLNEINSSLLSASTSVKTSEVGSEEPPTRIRRSLRTYDKLEDKDLEDDSLQKKKMVRVNNKSDELSKSKDCKLLNKKPSYQSKELEKNDKVSNVKIQKSKSRNVSESSISSDNSKQFMSLKNSLADLTVSDNSSRSVTPELLRGKTSNRSVTPESISRKSNLRSGDKDLKSKLALEKACIKVGHHVDIILPEIKIERFKTEKQSATSMELKSKHLVQNKNEANNRVKAKPRGRVTSDFLVVQQSPDVPLGKRSCSNKSL